MCKRDYIYNPATCSCETGKYVGRIIDDLVITSDEIIDAVVKSYDKETKTVPTNFKFLVSKISKNF